MNTDPVTNIFSPFLPTEPLPLLEQDGIQLFVHAPGWQVAVTERTPSTTQQVTLCYPVALYLQARNAPPLALHWPADQPLATGSLRWEAQHTTPRFLGRLFLSSRDPRLPAILQRMRTALPVRGRRPRFNGSWRVLPETPGILLCLTVLAADLEPLLPTAARALARHVQLLATEPCPQEAPFVRHGAALCWHSAYTLARTLLQHTDPAQLLAQQLTEQL